MHPWIEKIAATRLLVIGDVMLDRYYFADVTRISPEGPVPVALVKQCKNTLGGAANVAHNLARLGCRVVLAGIAGEVECESIGHHQRCNRVRIPPVRRQHILDLDIKCRG